MPDLGQLPPLEIAARLDRLRTRLHAEGLDALVVTRLPNVRYLSGFTGSAAILLVGAASETVFVTDGRYAEQSHEQLALAGVTARIEVRLTSALQLDVLAGAIRDADHRRVGLEAAGVTWAQQRDFAAAFGAVELVPAPPLIEDLRRTKDAGEVARIAAACAIADDAFCALLPELGRGTTERDFALALEFAMRERGASGNSFDPIIASGPNGSKPHARPTDRVIERNELVVCDFGCVVDGYCSDMTRTVSVGEPANDARRLYDVVLDAQRLGREAVREGADVVTVDAACRDRIAAEGWAERFAHGTGHGVGLEIHEAPRVAASGRGTLVVRDIVTVEPGVYLPGVGGVRIEDTLVVHAHGGDILTHTPKELVI